MRYQLKRGSIEANATPAMLPHNVNVLSSNNVTLNDDHNNNVTNNAPQLDDFLFGLGKEDSANNNVSYPYLIVTLLINI